MKGYKVMESITGRLTSAFVGKSQGAVKYRENEWTKPHKGNGPLGVFDSRKSAISFLESFSCRWAMKIYSCDYVPSSVKPFWFRFNGIGKRIINDGCYQLPTGTVFADAVKPTKLVWEPKEIGRRQHTKANIPF